MIQTIKMDVAAPFSGLFYTAPFETTFGGTTLTSFFFSKYLFVRVSRLVFKFNPSFVRYVRVGYRLLL